MFRHPFIARRKGTAHPSKRVWSLHQPGGIVPSMTGTTLTPTRNPVRDDAGSGSGAPWRVVVLNDNHNTFDGVAFALASVIPGVSFEKGLELANRIHGSGRATVWSGPREPAELYWEQLSDAGLTMAPLEQG